MNTQTAIVPLHKMSPEELMIFFKRAVDAHDSAKVINPSWEKFPKYSYKYRSSLYIGGVCPYDKITVMSGGSPKDQIGLYLETPEGSMQPVTASTKSVDLYSETVAKDVNTHLQWCLKYDMYK